jgi:uncharacterized protein (DUF2062 family)
MFHTVVLAQNATTNLINLWFTGSYIFAEFRTAASPGLKGGALAGILVGTIVAAIAVSVFSTVFIMKRRRKQRTISRRSCKAFPPFYPYKNVNSFPCAA